MKQFMKKKILVIDDEVNIADSLSDILTLKGYEVTSVYNGADGLDCAVNEPPDLILCDVMMPNLNGYDLLSEIRSNIETRQIPFIFLTARGNQEDFRKGMNLGADDYLIKPVENKVLFQVIESRLLKYQELVEKGHLEENERIRRDLHDTIQQTILGVQMRLTNFKEHVGPSVDLSEIDKSLEYIKIAMAQLRMILEFDVVNMPDGFNIQYRLREMLERVAEYVSFEISFNTNLKGLIPWKESFVLLRATMEILNNVIKHSNAKKLFIYLTEGKNEIGMVFLDDGNGFDPKTVHEGFGMSNIRKRVKSVGGSLSVDSQIGAGTTYEIVFRK